MEKFEVAKPNTYEGETDPERPKIEQTTTYDKTTETEPEQIKVREYIDSFDEKVLKEIFLEYFEKSGNERSSINLIPFDKVRILWKESTSGEDKESASGRYSVAEGVSLNSQLLCDSKEETLWTLIHEECHAVSQDDGKYYDLYNKEGDMFGERFRLRSGVSELAVTRKRGDEESEINRQHNSINEGITELITERIYKEYKKRTGTSVYEKRYETGDDTVSDTEKTTAHEKFGGYRRNWQNAKLYIEMIAAISEVPPDVVENGIVRAYLRNSSIDPYQGFDGEVRSMLVDIHPDLIAHLSLMITSGNEFDPTLSFYIDYINKKDIPGELKDKFADALQKLKDEWGEAYKIAGNQI